MSLKKGWRRYGAAVVCLVMLSMLVPLVFLLGLYGGFQTGYVNEGGPPALNQTEYSRSPNSQEHKEVLHQSEGNHSRHPGDYVSGFKSPLLKDFKDEVATKHSNFSANNGNHSRHLGDHVSRFKSPLLKDSKDGVATKHSNFSANDGNHSRHLGDHVSRFGSPLLKDSKDGVATKHSNFSANDKKPGALAKVDVSVPKNNISGATDRPLDKGSKTKHPNLGGLPKKSGASSLSGVTTYKRRETKRSVKPDHIEVKKDLNADYDLTDELEKACEAALGSYCTWSSEHREEIAHSMVGMLKDQLFLARAYYPSISKHHNREKMQRELRQHIQDSEHMLSEATADADLPEGAREQAKNMERVLAKVKSYPVDCNNVVKKLVQILDTTQEEANFHRRQSVFLYQLAVQTMPKSLHCLSMRLTIEYFRTYKDKSEFLLSEKLEDQDLYHYVIYSTNILAASVVVNSTVIHAKEPEKHVFHLITDRQNYAAMKFWFLVNPYANATVHVQNLDDLNLLHSSNSMMDSLSSEEFRVAVESPTERSSDFLGLNKTLEYLSVFNHPHFQLPETFPKLNKVLFLDDDVVVQRDLTHLWSIDLQGKVNGAVEVCEVRLDHLKKYLSAFKVFGNGFNGSVCAWVSGVNIIDLQQWRKQDLTKVYKRWLKLQNGYKVPWRFGTLPASLITFYNMTHGLDNSWVSFGLGHNFGIDQLAIENSAVLHYNGNLKPWLEIGISKYKSYWAKFLKQDDQFMLECNVNG